MVLFYRQSLLDAECLSLCMFLGCSWKFDKTEPKCSYKLGCHKKKHSFEFLTESYFTVNPLMHGDNKKITHT